MSVNHFINWEHLVQDWLSLNIVLVDYSRHRITIPIVKLLQKFIKIIFERKFLWGKLSTSVYIHITFVILINKWHQDLGFFSHGLTTERVDITSKDPKRAYNRSLVFHCDNYNYWKESMSVNIQSCDMYILDFVVNRWFEPQIYVGVIQNKPKVDWKANDTKKV